MATVTDVLNTWNEIGVFSYIIPFLLIFAVVFAILQKTQILGKKDETKGLQAIIAVAVGLLALQLDYVAEFFAVIFPRFGVGLSVFLVLVILLGFFFTPKDGEEPFGGAMQWIGWLTGIGVVVWALTSWDDWSGNFGLSGWLSEYFWPLIILAAVIGAVVTVSRKDKDTSPPKTRSGPPTG